MQFRITAPGASPTPQPRAQPRIDHDIRVPIFRTGRVVARSCRIRILVITLRNPHDLPRTRLAPVLDRSTASDSRLMPR